MNVGAAVAPRSWIRPTAERYFQPPDAPRTMPNGPAGQRKQSVMSSSTCSRVAMPSSTTRLASRIMAKYTRFATKPQLVGASFTTIGFLAHLRGQVLDRGDGLLARLRRADDLGEAHHRRGRRPVPAHDPVGAVGGGGERGDREARCVRREDRGRRRDAVEVAEHAHLHLDALGDRLDHDVDVGGVVERVGEREPFERGVGVGARQLAALDGTVEAEAPGGHVLVRRSSAPASMS